MTDKEIKKIIKILKENPKKYMDYYYELRTITYEMLELLVERYNDANKVEQKLSKGATYLNAIHTGYGICEIEMAISCDSNGFYFHDNYKKPMGKYLIRPMVDEEKLSREFLGDELYKEVEVVNKRGAKPEVFRALLEKILIKIDPLYYTI